LSYEVLNTSFTNEMVWMVSFAKVWKILHSIIFD